MDDKGLWYYVIIGIIYMLSRVLGKKKKPVVNRPPPQPDTESPSTTPSRGTFSFEDILKELSGEVEKKGSPMVPERSIEPISGDVYLETEPQNVTEQVPEKLEEPRAITQRRKVDFTRNEKYAIGEAKEIDYLEVLNQQDGPAKAFVLSEIFNRKYQ